MQPNVDDLSQIKGIGPVIDRRLHEVGITKIDKLATSSPEEIAELLQDLAGISVERARTWISQARELTSEQIPSSEVTEEISDISQTTKGKTTQIPMVLLFDISKWQTVNDYQLLARRTAGGYIQATNGNQIDSAFNRHWQETKNVDLLRGAYHVWHPELSPEKQAKFFFQTVNATGDLGELPPVLDFEGKEKPDDVHIWLEDVEEFFGRRPVIYTNKVNWDKLGNTPWARDYPLWIAQYKDRSLYPWSADLLKKVAKESPRLPSAWQDIGWTFWQFTDNGKGLDFGINQPSNIDLNIFRGTVEDLKAFAGAQTLTTRTTTIPSQPGDSPVLERRPDLAPTDEERRAEPTIAAPERSSFDNDQPGEGDIDSLNFRNHVRSFTRLVAARDVTLPIAIGLFGNWGVGKTHFMRMLHNEVTALTSRQEPEDDQSTYMRRIAQIDFNAWNYIDTNLWAGLALRIFDGLSQEIQRKPEHYEAVRTQLRTDLESSNRARNLALTRQKKAQQSRENAVRELEKLRSKREEEYRNFENARLRRLLDKKIKEINPEEIKKIAEEFGLSPVIETAEDTRKLAAQLQELNGSLRGVMFALGNQFSSVPRGAATVLVVFLVLAVILLAFGPLVDLLRARSALFQQILPQALDDVLQIAGIASAAIAWVGRKLNALARGVSYLEKVQTELVSLEADEEIPESEKKYLDSIASLNEEIERAEQEIHAAERVISDTQAELQRINAGGLVYDFVESRGQDPRYLENLGLISIIRQDLEKLEGLMKDWNENYNQKIDPLLERQEESQTREDQEATPANSPPIERIILYIDDLDRCPLDKVVEVLQAVHLLLAFRLFVVIVAVDPRWLERSLYKTYAPELVEGQDGRGTIPSATFSSQNYLEKIFQIPFSLPRMSREGFRQLMDDLITTRSENKPPAQLEGELVVDESADETHEIAQDDQSEDGGSGAGKTAVLITKAEARTSPEEDEPAPPYLEDWEQDFLQLLHPFVGTPRLAKRLLNIYRLLRVRAGTAPFHFDRFIEYHNGEFRGVLLLLAMIIGCPKITGKILGLLSHQRIEEDWESFLKQLDPDLSTDQRRPWVEKVVFTDLEREQYAELMAGFRQVQAQLQDSSPEIEIPTEIGIYQRWASEVGRYSFHWHIDRLR